MLELRNLTEDMKFNLSSCFSLQVLPQGPASIPQPEQLFLNQFLRLRLSLFSPPGGREEASDAMDLARTLRCGEGLLLEERCRDPRDEAT